MLMAVTVFISSACKMCSVQKVIASSIAASQTVRMRNRRLFSSRVYDVAITGGGIMGLSTAYFLASRMDGRKICVIERDPSYKRASTVLSVASVRQQFSIPENVLLSKFSYQFMQDIKRNLSVEGEDPSDIQFKNGGYLFLASESGLETLVQNHRIQRELDCSVVLLTASELKEKYPWMNTDDISMASLGTSGEGWFDPWLLLTYFKKKVLSMGVQYINAEITNIETNNQGQVSGVKVTTSHDNHNEEGISCKYLVNSAGPWAGRFAAKLGIHLPVEPRRRCIFVLDCPDGPKFDLAFLVDKCGLYLRYEGGCYVTGMAPDQDADTESDDLTVDYDFFTEVMWPILVNRIPAFEKLKVQSAWSGFYEYNTLDQNAIIGFHPEVKNLVFINGFSGHGIQQSPAAGRAVSELLLDGEFTTINLTRLGYDRILRNEPLKEKNIL